MKKFQILMTAFFLLSCYQSNANTAINVFNTENLNFQLSVLLLSSKTTQRKLDLFFTNFGNTLFKEVKEIEKEINAATKSSDLYVLEMNLKNWVKNIQEFILKIISPNLTKGTYLGLHALLKAYTPDLYYKIEYSYGKTQALLGMLKAKCQELSDTELKSLTERVNAL